MKEQTFQDIEKMLWKIVWDFQKMNGDVFGTSDELFSDACLGFLEAYDTYDMDLGQFTTHTYWRARGKLYSRKRKICKQPTTTPIEGIEVETGMDTITRIACDLSNDGKTLLKLAVDPPVGLQKCLDEARSRILKRRVLRHYLMGLQWDKKRTESAFLEIQEVLP